MPVNVEPLAADTDLITMREANRRLQALVDFGRELRTQVDPNVLLTLIPRYVAQFTGCPGAAALLFDAETNVVGRAAAFGMGDTFAADWRRAVQAEGLASASELALAAQSGAITVCPGIGDDPRLSSVRECLLASGRQSAVVAPLQARNTLLGVMVAYDCPSGSHTGDGLAFLSSLADEAAAAIYNARLFVQTQRDLRRRDAVHKVVVSISSELDLNHLLERVVESAVELLNATGGSISLVDSEGVASIQAVYNLSEEMIGPLEPSEGITGQVLLARQPVSVNHYTQDLPYPMPSVGNMHAALGVPIWWQGKLIGVFTVLAADPSRTFDRHDREAMDILASHVASAIENARLYGELQERLNEMVGVQRIGAALLDERDFDRVLQVVCEQLQRLTDADGVGLALLAENGQDLDMRTVVGPTRDLLQGARIPIKGSFAGLALHTNQPQRTDDAMHDPRGYTPSLVMGHTRTLLSVPMKTRQRSVGVLSIYNKRGGGGFTNRDAELATVFANQAAAAIENARLYEQTREYTVIEERNRLARELHDSVTQSLFSVTLLAQASLSLWDRDPPKARERMERATELAQGALAEMRALIFELRPMALKEEGLAQALRKHLAALRSRHGLEATLHVEGTERRVPTTVEEAAFRIVQESLNNVVKHAQANHVEVTLKYQDAALRTVTSDDGVGFTPSAARRGGMGMSSMRERAEAVGGNVAVSSRPGRGTRVTATLPVPLPSEGEPPL
jgi:signal transduction histidine kinase